jgi:hypothetical protein
VDYRRCAEKKLKIVVVEIKKHGGTAEYIAHAVGNGSLHLAKMYLSIMPLNFWIYVI